MRVLSPDSGRFRELLAGPGVRITNAEADVLEVLGLESQQIGTAASAAGLNELAPHQASLEEAFMDLTRDAAEYRSTALAEVNPATSWR